MKILFVGDQHYSSENLPARRDNYPETCLEKTRQVLELGKELDIDMMVLSGDFSHLKRMSFSFLNKLIYLFREYKYLKASAVGNHDCYYAQPETVERGSLGTMFMSGTFLPKPGDWLIETDDTIIFFIPYMLEQIPVYIANPNNKKLVLAAHLFFEKPSFKDNLPEDYVDKFDYILLGHDHDPYPIKKKGRATIVRPGSLTRGTRHFSNWNRGIQVAYIDTATDTCKYLPIQSKLATEIFSKERMDREVTVKNSKIVEELSKKVDVNELENILDILNTVDIDNDVKENTKKWLTIGKIL